METGTPSIARVASMVLFAFSCVGLLLFLWLSFGGTIPFNPQGYQVKISFPSADQLGTQADVRISGVTVGKVVAKSIDPRGDRTVATLNIDNKFAPIRQDTRAILRQKTILGETYVELTPGTQGSPTVADGGELGRAQVQPAVQLAQVFNTFDPTTRNAFQVWQQDLAGSLENNALNLSNVIGNLPAFAADASSILSVLNVEHSSVVNLVKNGSTVFAALSQSQSALRNLITSGEATFAATASVNTALADTFQVFPTFLNESQATFARLKTFSLDTDPLIRALNPVAQQLGPTLQSVRALAPDLRRLFTNLGPLITVSKTGLPAVRDVVNGATPLLGAVGPFLQELNPILSWLSLHQQLISDFISQGASGIAAKIPSTSYGGGGGLTCSGVPCGHYLRQFSPLPATAGYATARGPNDRGNTYPPPLWLAEKRNFTAGGTFPGSFAQPSWDCINAGGQT
ncbi:MAG: MCE family protein, partial [Candidatus Dormibacteraeota bacterium]|nr:MCE family protein [Candidatus Dormibacteraeota bacterium]